jgi:hypothetical protein
MSKHRRERWYGVDGQSRVRATAHENTNGVRKILSLVVLLVLVLILIQQASNPKKVERVATAIGLFPDPRATGPQAVVTQTSSPDPASPLESSTVRDSTVRDSTERERYQEIIGLHSKDATIGQFQQIWKALLDRAKIPVVQQLARREFGSQATTSDESIGSGTQELDAWYQESKERLERWVRIEAETALASTVNGQQTQSVLLRFSTLFFQSERQSDDSPLKRSLHLALDAKLLSQVEDNAPWRMDERLPFLRCWQRADSMREAIAAGYLGPKQLAKLDVSQILASGSSMRGKPIRFEGSVARVDPDDKVQDVEFGKHDYKIFWLRPSDGNPQPVKVYVALNGIDQNLILDEQRNVSLCGFFFKRIAYASQRGADVAPLLMAAYVGPETASLPPNFVTGGIAENPLDVSTAAATPNWFPPIDLSGPLEIVKQRMVPLFSDLTSTSFKPFRSLATLAKLQPEMESLTQTGRAWPLVGDASIVQAIGQINQIKRLQLDEETAIALEATHAYECELQTKEGSTTIICRSVPSTWIAIAESGVGSLMQPAIVSGIRNISQDGTRKMWADRIQWCLPNGLEPIEQGDVSTWSPPVSEQHRFLMQHQWDLGWMDLVSELQSEPVKPLLQSEMKPYLSLIKIAKQHPFVARGTKGISIHGKPIYEILEKLRLEGAVRTKREGSGVLDRVAMDMRIVRVTKVSLEDPLQHDQLGSDHYFQLDAMVDVGDRTYEIATDKDAIVYHKEYPVTCVLAELPDWLSTAAKQNEGGEQEGMNAVEEQVWYPRMKGTGEGWFYRFWKYKTQEMSQSFGDKGRQLGPLIVLDSLERINRPTSEPVWNGFSSKLVSTVIGIIGIAAIWWFLRTRLNPSRRH